MKIAIITDTHWGVRGDSTFFHDITKKFLDTVFFPYLETNSINTILHLGDLLDRRKYVNYYTAQRLRSDFLDIVESKKITTHILLGNHDMYFKDTHQVNAFNELLGDRYGYITTSTEAEVRKFDGLPILLVPWICNSNQENTYNLIKSTNAQICMGHLELDGFQMYKGIPAHGGIDPKPFEKFDMVFSGHYHTKSNIGNIYYLGSHSEFTWSDYNDPRGFHIFDTQTRELTFIENPYKIFKKLYYDDTDSQPVINEDLSSSIVKVVIKNKSNPFYFDRYIEQVELRKPIEVQIVEDHLNLHLEDDVDIVDEAESTVDIFKKYIAKIEMPNVSKVVLEKTILDIYHEALNMEVE